MQSSSSIKIAGLSNMYFFIITFSFLLGIWQISTTLLKNPLLSLKMRGFRSSCLLTSHKVLLTRSFKMTFAFWSRESSWTYAVMRSLMLGCGRQTGCESLVSRFVFAFFTEKKYEQWIGQKVQLKRKKRNSCSVVRQSCGYITSIFHGCSHGISQRAAFQSHDGWSCPAGLLSSNQSPDR